MLVAKDVSISFGAQVLFENVNFNIERGSRIGLIGKNGAGKSTLLKILSRQFTPDSGNLNFQKNIRIGFLEQDINFQDTRLIEEIHTVFVEIKQIEKEIHIIHKLLAKESIIGSEKSIELLDKLDEKSVRLKIIGGDKYLSESEKMLLGLGFRREDFQKKASSFSGGWRMRIQLAKLLLQNFDLLLLDEPTNHLDIHSIIWLEKFLINYDGVVIIVSHDVQFLDNTTNRTMEIIHSKLLNFKKPYSKYKQIRTDVIEKQISQQKNQLKKIEQTEKLIEKFRAKSSKAKMAQSLIKKVQKIKLIEVENENINTLKIDFKASSTSGKVVLEAYNISKKYEDREVLRNVNFHINRGEKIAFVGKNGEGKTTLLKTLIKAIPFSGKVKYGYNVEIGYLAQNQAETLNENLTLLETLEEVASDKNRKNIRNVLGTFLFSGDDVSKKVKVLSGGERSRLVIARMLFSSFNFLVMDEPTNHLDLQSKLILKDAIRIYDGTLLLVSHDRYFLEGLVDIVYEVGNMTIKQYLGGINDYIARKEENTEKNEEKKNKTHINNLFNNKDSYKENKKRKNKITKLENQIENIEFIIKELERKMTSDENTSKIYKDYGDWNKKLKELMTEWEKLNGI